MHNSIEIEKKTNGFSVDVMLQRDDEYDVEELVFQDPLDVLAEVLRWLGYDEDTGNAVIELLDESTAYVLTDKGRETLAQMERERAELARVEQEGMYWKQADRDWEIRRLEAEIAAMKRGSGLCGVWGNTTEQYETTTTGR